MIPAGVFRILIPVVTVIIALDFAGSFKTAMDIRNILVGMEKVREEMARMHRRLDVIVALAEDDKKQFKKNLELRLEERADELERRLEKIFEKLQSEYEERMESNQNELNAIRDRLSTMKNTVHIWFSSKRFFKRSMLLGNPSMCSKLFKEHFEELKQQLEKK